MRTKMHGEKLVLQKFNLITQIIWIVKWVILR
jgi:hypothetical protein